MFDVKGLKVVVEFKWCCCMGICYLVYYIMYFVLLNNSK